MNPCGASVKMAFLAKTEEYSIVCFHHILPVNFSFGGYLGCFQLGDSVNNAAADICIQVSTWIVAFISF